ncbi:MAG: glycosyltransferase family 2 protein [Leptospiraceae bacterium]|nr:glycosyltransferase family 2 protein [Leptospiraceae bacterium]MCK6382163.1 glycosyltransferase family 2 protein [Leptospiraceae bacterium]NUM40985.1 glycosyltransferase family 2 protein [Leptospiraceae bacterium]
MKKEKLLTIVPAYNEESTIEEVVLRAIPYSDICVVDDASKDNTPKILSKLLKKYPKKLHVITHTKNTHIPGGIQDGMKYAEKKSYDWVVTMDAGLSHDPKSLEQFFSHPSCDILIGRREITENVPMYRKLISYLAAKVMNYCMSKSIFDLFGPKIKDCTSGFRRYSKKSISILANSKLQSKAFDFHMEALYLIHASGGTVSEIGIHYVFSNSSFNKKVFRQAVSFAWTLLKKKFR